MTFYVRIYKEARFRWVIYGAGIVVTCWGLSSTLAIVFGCTPIRRFWDRQLDGHCTDLNEIWLTTGALNCVLDALIIFLVCLCAHETFFEANRNAAGASPVASSYESAAEENIDHDLPLSRLRLRNKCYSSHYVRPIGTS